MKIKERSLPLYSANLTRHEIAVYEKQYSVVVSALRLESDKSCLNYWNEEGKTKQEFKEI